MKWFDFFIFIVVVACIIFILWFIGDFIQMEIKYHILKYIWREVLP